jgi:hypothetical protein
LRRQAYNSVNPRTRLLEISWTLDTAQGEIDVGATARPRFSASIQKNQVTGCQLDSRRAVTRNQTGKMNSTCSASPLGGTLRERSQKQLVMNDRTGSSPTPHVSLVTMLFRFFPAADLV